jgi:hypothetical protein
MVSLPPSMDAILYGVLDAQQLYGIVPELEKLLKWAAELLRDLREPVPPPSHRKPE